MTCLNYIKDSGKSRAGLTSSALEKGAVSFFFFPTGGVVIYPTFGKQTTGTSRSKRQAAVGDDEGPPTDGEGKTAGGSDEGPPTGGTEEKGSSCDESASAVIDGMAEGEDEEQSAALPEAVSTTPDWIWIHAIINNNMLVKCAPRRGGNDIPDDKYARKRLKVFFAEVTRDRMAVETG